MTYYLISSHGHFFNGAANLALQLPTLSQSSPIPRAIHIDWFMGDLELLWVVLHQQIEWLK
jgi:hypothetical protein